jgi:site-specific recombinase XerD
MTRTVNNMPNRQKGHKIHYTEPERIFPSSCEPGDEAGRRRLQLWEEAVQAWLARQKAEQRKLRYQSSRRAWMEFARSINKPPWQAREADVQRWVDGLLKKEFNPTYIAEKVRFLRKFYHDPTAQPLEREEANPAAGISIRGMTWYGSVLYLSIQEAQALLAAVDKDTSIMGKRDYAILLAFLLMGLKSQEVQAIQWGDIFREEGQVFVYLPSKTKKKNRNFRKRKMAVPQEVWEAIDDFLRASGRLPVIPADEFVFAPITDIPTRIPTGEAGEWNGKRPMSTMGIQYMVKTYAEWAGLDSVRVNTHVLRHSAAMFRMEAGDDVDELSEWLGCTRGIR